MNVIRGQIHSLFIKLRDLSFVLYKINTNRMNTNFYENIIIFFFYNICVYK